MLDSFRLKSGSRKVEHKSQLQLHQIYLSGKKHGEESSDHFAETETGRDQGACVLGLVGSSLPSILQHFLPWSLISWVSQYHGAMDCVQRWVWQREYLMNPSEISSDLKLRALCRGEVDRLMSGLGRCSPKMAPRLQRFHAGQGRKQVGWDAW